MDKIYFKTENDGIYHKLEIENDNYVDSPLDYYTIGTMLFKQQNKYKLGHKQTDSFSDFFINELNQHYLENNRYESKITVNLPTIEEVKNHRVLSKLYLNGDDKNGYRLDKDLIMEHLERQISNIFDNYKDMKYIDNIECNLTLDENNKLLDKIEIDITSPKLNSKHTYTNEDSKTNLKEVVEHIGHIIDTFDFEHSTTEIKEKYNYDFENMNEKELFDEWSKNQFLVLPINIYEHSGIALNPASYSQSNSGYIYISKDDRDIQLYQKNNTQKETKEWVENNFKQLLKEYENYLNGNVNIITEYEFDKKTLDWNYIETTQNFFGDDLDYIKQNYDKVEYISNLQMYEIEKTITNEFIEETAKNFFNEVANNLTNYNGNLEHTQKAILKSWENDELKTQAINQYFSKNEEKREFDPTNKNYETYIKLCSNPDASNYNSLITPDYALIVDKENKRYGVLVGPYKFDSTYLPNYKKNKTIKTLKSFKEKIRELESYGFKFEKFTNKNYENSQCDIKQLFNQNKEPELSFWNQEKYNNNIMKLLSKNPETYAVALKLAIKELTKNLNTETKINIFENILNETKQEIKNKSNLDKNENCLEDTNTKKGGRK